MDEATKALAQIAKRQLDEARSEVARLTAELNECKKAVDICHYELRNFGSKMLDERDQALARAAAAAGEMRERVAREIRKLQDEGCEASIAARIRDLPISGAGQAALDKLLAKVREDAIREAAYALYNKPQGICTEGAAHKLAQHVLTLLNNGDKP